MRKIYLPLFVCCLLYVPFVANAEGEIERVEDSVIEPSDVQIEEDEGTTDDLLISPTPVITSEPEIMESASFNKEELTLPGDSWYTLKRWGERLSVLFTFDKEKKAEKMMTLTDRRLEEAKTLAENEEYSLAKETLRRYRTQMSNTADHVIAMQEESRAADDLLEKVSVVALEHQQDLMALYSGSPEEMHSAIENALKNNSEEYESTLLNMSDEQRAELLEQVKGTEQVVASGITKLRAAGVDVPEMETIQARVQERAKDELTTIAKEKVEEAKEDTVGKIKEKGENLLEKIRSSITITKIEKKK